MATNKNYVKLTFKTREEWLKARGFGGSSASAILDKNPHMSKLELYRAIVMPSDHPLTKENEAMYYGTRCEPIIRKLFAYDFKDKYRVHSPVNNEMYKRIDKPYMTATLDGILTEKGSKRKGVFEIKTHDIRNREDEKNWSGQIPDNYYIQILHYLMVMNDFDFVVLVAKLRFFDYYNEDGKKLLRTEIRYYYKEREECLKDLEFLEKKETEFWEYNITKKVMPIVQVKF